MHSAGSASKIKLNSFDDLFGVSDAEQIIQVELTELYPFKNHPFRVLDDKKMEETVCLLYTSPSPRDCS